MDIAELLKSKIDTVNDTLTLLDSKIEEGEIASSEQARNFLAAYAAGLESLQIQVEDMDGGKTVHTHRASCYGAAGKLLCGYKHF